jgi:DNA cross-link repair 1B protein
MARIITHTNVIVDDFDFCKSFPRSTFVHFLTHFHSDHYEGLSPLWDYGDIHCTHQTKAFLLDKYPKLQRVHAHDYGQTYSLTLVKDHLDIEFTLFDAKHIPGAAMILFRGYMGTILFTGDFRYEWAMVKENPILFPPRLRDFHEKRETVEQMQGISLPVDEMIFDNTYCNPAFSFGLEPQIAEQMVAIIEKSRDKKLVYIAMGALGKHRILMRLAQHFQTQIVVTPKQRRKVELAGLRTDFLTTEESEGFIQLISKKNRAAVVERTRKGPLGEQFICIDTDFLMLSHQAPDGINYIVPYSLHSNFAEMQTLVRMVQPCILRKVVVPYSNFKQVKLRVAIDHRLKFSKYLDFLQTHLSKSESGYSQLVKDHTAIYNLSSQFLQWFYPKQQARLMHLLGLGDGRQDHTLRKRMPVLLSEEEMASRSRQSKGKEKLHDIAARLNATNKNTTLENAFRASKEQQNDRKFKDLFESESWEYSNSRTQYLRSFPERSQCSLSQSETKKQEFSRTQSFF